MANLARGDVTEPEIVREVLNSMFRPGKKKLESALDAHFADGIEVKNPLYRVQGKEKLYNLLRLWETAFEDEIIVQDTAVHGNRALAKVRHNLLFRPFSYAPRFVLDNLRHLLTVPMIVNAEFTFIDTARGKRIIKITDDISIYTIIYNIPFAQYFWHNIVEPMSGQVLVTIGQVVDWGLPQMARLNRELLPGYDLGLDRI
eukprot:jgi/Chrzof1/7836/Cz02g38100.t1